MTIAIRVAPKTTGAAASLALALASAPAAHASIIYAAAWKDGVYAVDVDAGTTTRIFNDNRVWSLAGSDDPDLLYFANHHGPLRSLHIPTGDVTTIRGGSLASNSLGVGPDAMLYAGSWSDADLIRVDPATGLGAVVGAGDIPSYGGDIALGPDELLYAVSADNTLVTVDTLTGATSSVMALPAGDAWGLAFTADGRAWASIGESLFSLDIDAGTATVAMNLGFTAYDLATPLGFVDTSGRAVPTPSTALLGVIALALAPSRRRSPHAHGA